MHIDGLLVRGRAHVLSNRNHGQGADAQRAGGQEGPDGRGSQGPRERLGARHALCAARDARGVVRLFFLLALFCVLTGCVALLRQLSRKAKRQMKKALVSTQVQEARGAGKAPSSHAILRAQVPRCLTTLLALLDARLRVARARTHTRPLSLSHYVCVRVYVCTCVRVCKCVCVCVCVYVCVYIYLVRLRVADPYTHTHSHTLTYMCVFQGVTDAKNTHICQKTHTYVNIYVCLSGGTHIYVNVYVKRHANMSTYMCFSGGPGG